MPAPPSKLSPWSPSLCQLAQAKVTQNHFWKSWPIAIRHGEVCSLWSHGHAPRLPTSLTFALRPPSGQEPPPGSHCAPALISAAEPRWSAAWPAAGEKRQPSWSWALGVHWVGISGTKPTLGRGRTEGLPGPQQGLGLELGSGWI